MAANSENSEMRTSNHSSCSSEREIYLSIVIRARNEAKHLGRVFEALTAQRCSFPWEIIVVDNESEDETLQLCEQYEARVVPIRCEEWTPGCALNVGISQARGELVLLLSAHSVPVGTYFLERAVAPFDDPAMAGVRCLITGNSEQMAEWFKPRDIQYRSLEEQKAAESGEGWTATYPLASGCVIRRSVWEQVPYDESYEGVEDKIWASQALQKGFKIRCCADAVYVHTRKRGEKEERRRSIKELKSLHRYTGYVPLSWSQFIIRIAKILLSSPVVAVRYVIKGVLFNIGLVTIPWQAKSAPRVGSLPEYDKHQ